MRRNRQAAQKRTGPLMEGTARKLSLAALVAMVILTMLCAAVYAKTTELEAGNMVNQLETRLDELKEEGYPTVRLDDLLAEMKKKLSDTDYDGVAQTYNQTQSLISRMIKMESDIRQVGSLLEEARRRDVNITEITEQFNLGLSEYQNNNFEGAEPYLETSKTLLVNNLRQHTSDMKDQLKELLALSIANNLTADVINRTLERVEEHESDEDYVSVFTELSRTSILNDTTHKLLEMKETISELENQGMHVERFHDNLKDMMRLLESEDYESFYTLHNQTGQVIEKTRTIAEKINETLMKMESPELEGIDLSEAKELMTVSIEEFSLENYEKSENYLERARTRIADLEKEYVLTSILNKTREKYDPIGFLKKHWLALILLALFLNFFIRVGKNVIRIVVYENRLRRLEQEQEALVDLMRQLQESYYMTKEIDRDTYETEKDNFEKRTAHINKEYPIIAAKIQKEQERLAGIFTFFSRRNEKRKKEKGKQELKSGKKGNTEKKKEDSTLKRNLTIMEK